VLFLQELDAALVAAKAETYEAIKAGNDNYNRLVATKLQREAELQEQLQQVSQRQVVVDSKCSLSTWTHHLQGPEVCCALGLEGVDAQHYVSSLLWHLLAGICHNLQSQRGGCPSRPSALCQAAAAAAGGAAAAGSSSTQSEQPQHAVAGAAAAVCCSASCTTGREH
jgi:hypothetical protein